jgi:hypothetical protein
MAKTKGKKNLWVFLLLGLVLCGTIYAVGKDQGWFTGEVDEPIVVVTPTTYTLKFYNYSSVLDGNDGRASAKGYLYEKRFDPDTFTESDKNDLTLTDFTLIRSGLEHNDIITPQVNTLYLLKVNCSDHGDKWIVPQLGNNTVKLRTTPTNCSLAMYDAYGSSTVNQTNSNIWYGSIINLDADAEISNECGYDLAYDLTLMTTLEKLEDSLLYPAIIIDTNGTGIELSDVIMKGLNVKEVKIDSDKIEIFLNEPIYGKIDFEIELDASDLGVDFEVESIYLARGIIGGTLTTLATATAA